MHQFKGSTLKLALVLLSGVSGFGCKKESSSSEGPALQYGTYNVAPSTCKSTGSEPNFPDPEKMVALGAFYQLTGHQVVFEPESLKENFTVAECTLSINRTLFSNGGTRFSFADRRTYTFAPEGCAIGVLFDEGVFSYSAANALFAEVDNPAVEEIPFLVDATTNAPSFLLTSLDESPYNSAWANFGCSDLDQIQMSWTPE